MRSIPLLLLCSVTLCAGAQESNTLKLIKTIPLPGVKGRFDHFAMDAKNHRIFVAALGNDTLEVLDLAAGKHLKSITGLHKPTGVVYLPDVNRIGVANGDDGTFKLFNNDSHELVKNIGSLDDADNARLDTRTKLIYNGYGDGALAIIDSVTMKQTGNIKLLAHPESFQMESDGPRIFVNLPDAKQVTVIDRDKKNVAATWPMKEFQANFPMALDETDNRLFIGCRKPARLVILDTHTGKPVTDLAISGDIDDLFYDAKRQQLYLACGEGFIDVIRQRNPDRYELLEKIPTRVGARTGFFSPERNEFYLAVPQHGNLHAEIRVFAILK
jgi:WD40 repeat protein